MRIAIALYVVSFLIFLSVLESIFSFLFSLALQKPVVFPLVQWFFLILEWLGSFLNLCVKGFFLFIATAFDHQTYGVDLIVLLGNLTVHFAEFPSVLFYPLVLIFGDVLATLPAELIAEEVEQAIDAAQATPSITGVFSAFVSAILVGIVGQSVSGEEEEDTDDRLTDIFSGRGG